MTRIGTTEIIADCADDVTRTMSFEELRDYENSKEKRIISLEFRAESDISEGLPRNRVFLSFETREAPYINTIDLVVSASDETGSAVRGRLIEVLKGTIAWYDKYYQVELIRTNMYFWLMLSVVLVGFIGFKIDSTKLATIIKDVSPISGVIGFLYGAIVGSALWWALRALNFQKNKLFPSAVFAFGQAIEQHDRLDNYRHYVERTLIFGPFVALATYLGSLALKAA